MQEGFHLIHWYKCTSSNPTITFETYINGSDRFAVEQMLEVLGYMSFLSLFGAFPFGLVADHMRSKLSGKRFTEVYFFS